jgi:hypothetical protein
MRSRAIRWLEDNDFTEFEAARLLPPTLAYAFRASDAEHAAWRILDHEETITAVKVNASLHAGQQFGKVHRPTEYSPWPWEGAYWNRARIPGAKLHVQ